MRELITNICTFVAKLESFYSLTQTALTSHVYAKQIFWRKKKGTVTSEEIIKELVATS